MHDQPSARRRGPIRWVAATALVLAAAGAAAQADAPASAVPAASTPVAMPASAPAACPACPGEPSAAVAQRLDDLMQAVEAAASAAAPPTDPWQDAKAVVLNVFSSRLDAWLFGGAGGSPGLVAQVAAALAFGLAALKFLLAWAQRNPATQPGPWGRFKDWARTRPAARRLNVVLAGGMLVISAAALYVVTAARLQGDGGPQALATVDAALQACQAELATARARPPAAPPPAVAVLPTQALEQLSASCDRAITATNARVEQVRVAAEEIASRQPWALSKLVGWLALGFLVVFAIRKW